MGLCRATRLDKEMRTYDEASVRQASPVDKRIASQISSELQSKVDIVSKMGDYTHSPHKRIKSEVKLRLISQIPRESLRIFSEEPPSKPRHFQVRAISSYLASQSLLVRTRRTLQHLIFGKQSTYPRPLPHTYLPDDEPNKFTNSTLTWVPFHYEARLVSCQRSSDNT